MSNKRSGCYSVVSQEADDVIETTDSLAEAIVEFLNSTAEGTPCYISTTESGNDVDLPDLYSLVRGTAAFVEKKMNGHWRTIGRYPLQTAQDLFDTWLVGEEQRVVVISGGVQYIVPKFGIETIETSETSTEEEQQ